MCGRYYVDDETSREIEKIVRKLDQRLKIEHGQDIHPSESAVVLTKECREVVARQMQWGFPGFQGKGLLINARAEAILDKKTFRDSVLHRRCVIPAHHFYEWSKNKEKYTFQSPKQDATLFMAGCYQIYNGQNRFVILTTGHKASLVLHTSYQSRQSHFLWYIHRHAPLPSQCMQNRSCNPEEPV